MSFIFSLFFAMACHRLVPCGLGSLGLGGALLFAFFSLSMGPVHGRVSHAALLVFVICLLLKVFV